MTKLLALFAALALATGGAFAQDKKGEEKKAEKMEKKAEKADKKKSEEKKDAKK